MSAMDLEWLNLLFNIVICVIKNKKNKIYSVKMMGVETFIILSLSSVFNASIKFEIIN